MINIKRKPIKRFNYETGVLDDHRRRLPRFTTHVRCLVAISILVRFNTVFTWNAVERSCGQRPARQPHARCDNSPSWIFSPHDDSPPPPQSFSGRRDWRTNDGQGTSKKKKEKTRRIYPNPTEVRVVIITVRSGAALLLLLLLRLYRGRNGNNKRAHTMISVRITDVVRERV